MMDRDRSGRRRARHLEPTAARAIVAMLDDIAPRFAEIVALYDETPSLQDRTCTTGIVGAELVDALGRRRPCRPRLGPQFRRAPRPRLSALSRACLRGAGATTAGDVDARVRVRIDEVEASIAMLQAPGSPACRRARCAVAGAARAREPREGVAVVEAFRGDVLVWLRLAADGRVARCHVRDASWFQWPLLEAAIEGNIVADFPLCNKSFNCSYSGHDLCMRTLLLKSLFARPVTIGGAVGRRRRARRARPRARRARARRLFGRSITIREVDAGSCNGCELEIHALNNAVYDVERFGIQLRGLAAPCRRAAGHRPGDPQHEGRAGAHLCGDAGSQMGGGGRRLRLRLRRVRGQLRGDRRGRQGDPGRPAHPGCPPRPIDLLKGLIALVDKATATP